MIEAITSNNGYPRELYNPYGMQLRPRLGANALRMRSVDGTNKRPLEPVTSGEPISLESKSRRLNNDLANYFNVVKSMKQVSNSTSTYHFSNRSYEDQEACTLSRSICTNPNFRKRNSVENSNSQFFDNKENIPPRHFSSISLSSQELNNDTVSCRLVRVESKSKIALRVIRRSARQTLDNVRKVMRRSMDLSDIKSSQVLETIVLKRKTTEEPFGLFVARSDKGLCITRLNKTAEGQKLSVGDEIVELNKIKSSDIDLEILKQHLQSSLSLKLLIRRA